MIFGTVPFDNGEGSAHEIFTEVLAYAAGKQKIRLPLGYRLQSKQHWLTINLIHRFLSPAFEDRPSTLEAAEDEAMQDFPMFQVRILPLTSLCDRAKDEKHTPTHAHTRARTHACK
jgi:hypothetical protein